MMKTIAAVLMSILCVLMVGCNQKSSNPTLANDIVKLNEQVSELKEKVSELEGRRAFDQFMQGLDKYAYLTPGAEGYSVVGFDLGVLTVQMSDVKPYANGSKVTLRFGNTLSSSIDGLKVKIEWGKVDENGAADIKLAKSKEMTFVQTLRGGAWTPIPVVLDGIPPSELGFVRIREVTHTGIRLLK